MALSIKAGDIKKGDPDLKAMKAKIDKITKQLQQGSQVVVGLPSESQPYPDGTSVLSVGFWNEFGTKHIPERPFLRETLRQQRQEWVALSEKLYAQAIESGVDPQTLLGVLGEQMQIDVQKNIDSGAWEPNAPAYARAKEKAGKTKPLIVTGHLRGSIRYVVRDRSDGDS